MHARIVSSLLAAVFVAAGCGTGFWAWTIVRHVDEVERISQDNLRRIDRLEADLDEIAQEELTYAASGGAAGPALERTSNAMHHLASETPPLLARLLSENSTPARAAAAASSTIAEIEGSARENVRAGLDLMAADLIFSETHMLRGELRQQFRALRAEEIAAAAVARASDLRTIAAAMGLTALLFAWALVRATRGPSSSSTPVHESVTPSAPAAADRSVFELDLKPAPLDLPAVANLCTAIGRMKSREDLERLLERTGNLLAAPGVVVWMAGGEELFPAAAYGYDLGQLGRLGPIAKGAVNATAAAWRTGQLQTVGGEATSRGAVVAPMLGTDRCIGVLAVEVNSERVSDKTTQATVSLVAAQLSAVVAPWPAGSSTEPADILPFERTASS
ncbi:MAG TPA: hypothetical protein VFO58_03880 [Vicinamibacterales bacterium]|nr:hypothetical protein [Vicinamibacterales bacterium]